MKFLEGLKLKNKIQKKDDKNFRKIINLRKSLNFEENAKRKNENWQIEKI